MVSQEDLDRWSKSNRFCQPRAGQALTRSQIVENMVIDLTDFKDPDGKAVILPHVHNFISMFEQWKPIATAPRDGRYILVAQDSPYTNERVLMAERTELGFVVAVDGQMIRKATHWMELPEPPVYQREKEVR